MGFHFEVDIKTGGTPASQNSQNNLEEKKYALRIYNTMNMKMFVDT
jgi:hypothetical protein